jgi:hypothetical protein
MGERTREHRQRAPAESTLEQERRFLDPEEVTFWRDRFGQLMLKLTDGREYREVVLTLAFPLTHPSRMLVVRDSDLKEIGMIDDYLTVDEQSRKLLEEELEKAYFVPRILRILSAQYGITSMKSREQSLGTFEVETDRGPRTIQVQFLQRVRFLPGGRVVLEDVDANRYEIASINNLDARSQALLEPFL